MMDLEIDMPGTKIEEDLSCKRTIGANPSDISISLSPSSSKCERRFLNK